MPYPTQQAMWIHVQPMFHNALEHSSTHAINHDQSQQTTEVSRTKNETKKGFIIFLNYQEKGGGEDL